MKNKLLLSFFPLFNIFAFPVFATGENCATPVVVNATCPVMTLSNQTSIGKSNDISTWYYNASVYTLSGEDIVYQVSVPANTTTLFVNTKGASHSGYIFSNTFCSSGPAASVLEMPYWFPAGDHDTSLCIPLINGVTTVFVYVDHNSASALNFSISFGLSRTLNFINVPNTRGNLSFATSICSVNSFSPFAELTFNGMKSVGPAMNLGNPYQLNDYCFTLYLKNTAGIEAPQIVEFTFDANFSNVGLINKYTSGRYANGIWQCSVNENVVTFVFHHNAQYGSGDFNGISNSCMQYNFCMRARPTIYGPLSVNVSFKGDGQNPGFSGVERQICVPTESTKCPPSFFGWAAPSAVASGNAAFSGNAMGTVLPVDFIDLWMSQEDRQAKINWTTAMEENLDHYVIQSSKDDGHIFTDVENVWPLQSESGQGINHYISSTDFSHSNASMFRIKSIDKDGQYKFSRIIYYSALNTKMEVTIAPNPVEEVLQIKSTEEIKELKLFNLAGDCVYVSSIPSNSGIHESNLDMSAYKKGFYILRVSNSRGMTNVRVIKN